MPKNAFQRLVGLLLAIFSATQAENGNLEKKFYCWTEADGAIRCQWNRNVFRNFLSFKDYLRVKKFFRFKIFLKVEKFFRVKKFLTGKKFSRVKKFLRVKNF